jgi:hypothetical protein
MDKENIDGLVSVVSTLGWKPQLRGVIGADADTFYDTFVAQNPQRAYEVAVQSQDPIFVQKVAERVIQSAVGGTDIEDAIRKLYLNIAPAAVSEPAIPIPAPLSHSGFSIESLPDRYRVHGVSYQGNLSSVDISKALLDDGKAHTQTDWVEVTRQGEWKLPSDPLYFAVLGALCDNKDAAHVEEVRGMLRDDLRNYFMMTSTRIRYASKGLDSVIHDVGYATESSQQTKIVGADGYINEAAGFGIEMQALVGINDCDRIESLGSYTTGKKTYFWRLNTKPTQDVGHALVLGGSNSGWFSIFANADVGGWARGMVVHVAKNSP